MSAHGLRGEGLGLRRDGATVLDGVTAGVVPGEIVALLGANGAGKSSLLRALLGLLPYQAGRVWLDGQPLERWSDVERARRVAYVPQHATAALPFSVRTLVELGRIPHAGFGRKLSRHDRDVADSALSRMGIRSLADRAVGSLSGGERQRVTLARALAQEAPLLVMDEPGTGLDFGEQLRLHALFRALADDGHGILYTTHQPHEAKQVAHRAVLLHRHRVLGDGPAAELITPATLAELYGIPLHAMASPGALSLATLNEPPNR